MTTVGETIPTKTIPDKLRRVFQRIIRGAARLLPGRKPSADVQEADIRPALEKYQADYNKRVEKLAEDFAGGKITLREWRAHMQNEIHLLQWASAAVGAGGFTNLSQQGGYEALERKVAEQVAYLNNWAADMERKGTPSAAYIANRARAYGGNSIVIASEAQNRAGGWPELPFQPKVSTKCDGGCKCGWVWKIIDVEKLDADVYWRLAPAEHCPTCIARAKACNPLQIRGGVIVNLPPNMAELIYRRE